MLDLMLYYITNGLVSGVILEDRVSLWWIAATVFALTTILYAIRFFRRGAPPYPMKPWMGKKAWLLLEFLTAVAGVMLDGWMAWFFGYIHFGVLLIIALLFFPTALHMQTKTESKTVNEEADHDV